MKDTTGAFTVQQFCRAYGISRTTLYSLWSAGIGPPRMKFGRATRIPKKLAERWIEKKAKEAS